MRGPQRKYNANGLAGCFEQRRRRCGSTVGVYAAAQAGMESDPETPWCTVCEDHSSIVCHPSLRLALRHAVTPEEWCYGCSGDHK